METMRPFVGLTNKARGYPGSILVCVLTNRRWLPLIGLTIVTQSTLPTASVSKFIRTSLFLQLRAKKSRNKCIVAKSLWTESRSEWTEMEHQHLFFDSTEELSRQGYFGWIYWLRAADTPEISVQPCLSFSSGNPQNDNSPKSRQIGLRSWQTTKNITLQQGK